MRSPAHSIFPAAARIVHIAGGDDGTIPLDAFLRAITAAAHAHGAIVILDCYQSAGAERIDPRALGVDICVGGMLKYLLGSAGIGYLCVRRGLIAALRRHRDLLA